MVFECLKKDLYLKDINTNLSSVNGALLNAFAKIVKCFWSDNSSDSWLTFCHSRIIFKDSVLILGDML